MSTVADCFRRVFWIVLLVALHVAPHATAQPRVMPQPALLPHCSPLCDSNLFGCLDIDDFGAHAYAHLMVLPGTDRRDAAAVFPLRRDTGLTRPLRGRCRNGLQLLAGERRHRSSARPAAPESNRAAVALTSAEPSAADVCRWGWRDVLSPCAAPADRPALRTEQCASALPGANALGLLTDLAGAAPVASRTFGPRNHDQSGRAVRLAWSLPTGEAAAQLGIHPVFRAR